jgi:hypothetical protein
VEGDEERMTLCPGLAAGAAPGTQHNGDGPAWAASAAWSTDDRGERRLVAVRAVGGRRRAVPGGGGEAPGQRREEMRTGERR